MARDLQSFCSLGWLILPMVIALVFINSSPAPGQETEENERVPMPSGGGDPGPVLPAASTPVFDAEPVLPPASTAAPAVEPKASAPVEPKASAPVEPKASAPMVEPVPSPGPVEASSSTLETRSGGGWTRLREGLTWSGYLRNETAFRTHRPAAFTKILDIANLEPRLEFGPRLRLSGRFRAYYDHVYDFEDIDSISPRKGPQVIVTESLTPEQVERIRVENVRQVEIRQKGLEARELYLDFRVPLLDLRLGKQIVRWGVVEGSRVTDEINPLDFSEFILREVNDRYIPLWMAKSDLYLGATTLETIWIPGYFLQFHRPAPRESEWEQFRILPGTVKPEKSLKNSEYAVKVSRMVLGWDLSGSYFYTWDDFPAAFRTVAGLGEFGVSPSVNFVPRYRRLSIFGTTASRSIGRFVVSGEAAYVIGKFFGARIGTVAGNASQNPVSCIEDGPTPSTTPCFGEEKKNYLKYATGVDFTLFKTDLSFSIIQQYILGWERPIIQDEFDTVYGFFGRRPFLNDRIIPQLLLIYFQNDQEILVRPRVNYNISDHVTAALGGDFLKGTIADTNREGVLLPGEFHFVGFFRNNSRLYVEMNYNF